MNKVVFHVDIDAFYASVEQKDNPSLKGKPVIVGARPGHRGVVSACSYEARRFGVRSAMPISHASRLCPGGVYLPVRMSRYVEVSKRVMGYLKQYSPGFRQLSIDEAMLDMTGTERLFGPPRNIAEDMRKEILTREGLVISVGIASNPYLAKLASEAGKPDGLFIVRPGEEESFVQGLPLEKLWGVGSKTLDRLQELNITTTRQLGTFSRETLHAMLGRGGGEFLYRAARGKNPGIHPETPKSRSVSHEITFEFDKNNSDVLRRFFLELAEQIMDRLIEENLKSKTLFIKLRYSDFTTVTARRTLRHCLTSSQEMHDVACDLLSHKWDGHSAVRLIGLGVSGVETGDAPEQQELFGDQDSKKKQVEETVSRIRRKIDGVVLTRASLLKRKDGSGL